MVTFSSGDDIKDMFIDTIGEGASSAAGIYVFDKFVAGPVGKVVGQYAGTYVDAVSGFLFGLAANYAAKHIGSEVAKQALRYAGAGAFGKAIAVDTLKDPAPPMSGGSSHKGNPWMGLEPVTLSYGQENQY